jgi:hypothetical protein
MIKMGVRAVLLCLMPVLPAAAQEAPAPAAEAPKPAPRAEPARPRPAQVPLRVQVAIVRFEGDKMVANLPFTLIVNAGDGPFTSLRMGVETPIPVTTFTNTPGSALAPATSFQYRTVGINIDCRADFPEDGRYRLEAKVEQSSVRATTEKRVAGTVDLPVFRTFNTSFKALLRDGQTTTHVVATDPVSGEVSRIDLGITVVR